MPTETVTLTPDALLDLPALPDGKHYELSDGELIVVGTAGAIHELIKSRVFVILVKYHLRTMSGQPFSEAVFTSGLSRARIPDVALEGVGRARPQNSVGEPSHCYRSRRGHRNHLRHRVSRTDG